MSSGEKRALYFLMDILSLYCVLARGVISFPTLFLNYSIQIYLFALTFIWFITMKICNIKLGSFAAPPEQCVSQN